MPAPVPGLGSLPVFLETGRKASLGVRQRRGGSVLLVAPRGLGKGRTTEFPMDHMGWANAWRAFRTADPAGAAAYAGRAAERAGQDRRRAEQAAVAHGWTVLRNGEQAVLSVQQDGLRIDVGGTPRTIAWSSGLTVGLPGPTTATLSGAGVDEELEFASPGEQRRFGSSLAAVQATANAAGARLDVPGPATAGVPMRTRLPMTTLTAAPNGRPFVDLGLVTATVAMSRNTFSDLGSDVKSTFGGNLGGVERALDRALEMAKDRLSDAARQVGADAIACVRFSVASVQSAGDRSQTVVANGTAIATASTTAGGPGA